MKVANWLLPDMNLIDQAQDSRCSSQHRSFFERISAGWCSTRSVRAGLGLTEVGTRMTNLHLACVDEKQVASEARLRYSHRRSLIKLAVKGKKNHNADSRTGRPLAGFSAVPMSRCLQAM